MKFLKDANKRLLVAVVVFILFPLKGFSQWETNWRRFPSEAEIQKAYTKFKQDYKDQIYSKTAKGGSKVINYQTSSSPFLKYHWISDVESKYMPKEYYKYMISGLLFAEKITYITEIAGVGDLVEPITFRELEFVVLFYYEKEDAFYFAQVMDNDLTEFDYELTKTPDYYLGVVKDDLNIIKDFDPRVRGMVYPGWATDNDVSAGTSISAEQDDSDSNFPWSVIIGGVIGAAFIAGIRSKMKKAKKSKNQKDDKKEEKEQVHYILQLSTESFDFTEEKVQSLTIKVWKITEKDKKQIPANIEIQNPEPALQIEPKQGRTPLKCRLELKGQVQKNSFNITVNAKAEGHTFQKQIIINTGGEKRIVFETAPDNKRSLRPDIKQFITLYAQVLDENEKANDSLSKKIVFTPVGDWVEISEPVWDDGWVAINVEASNPIATSALSHPPSTVEVIMRVDFEKEGEEPLQEKLVIQLLDCYLESEVYHCTFPITEDKKQLKFKVHIENAGEEKNWKFSGMYRIGVDIVDDPLTEIAFEKIDDISTQVILTGPVLLPSTDERSITKNLIISAVQGEEEPLESQITVTVTREGLFIERGLNEKNEILLHADKPREEKMEFSLFRQDEKNEQITADKKGLEKLQFELQNAEKHIENLVSVLKPEFTFDQLITTIPYGRYLLKTVEEIPGSGEIYNLKYRVSTETYGDEKQEDFSREVIVKVQTKDIGYKIKSWEQAYSECKYMIDNYVPHSNAREKLTQILDTQKYFLDAEGLTELRNRIGHIAAELILADGAEGYKEVDKWATRIETTLEWTQWAGDLCFAAISSYYLKGLGATAANMIKAEMIDAINFFIYEKDTGWEAFKDRQIDKLIPYLMSTTKGRLLSLDNIQKLVGNNKPLCWAVYVSCQFLFHLYQTKSMIEAAKNTAREIRDELLVQFLGKQLNSRNNIQKAPKETSAAVKKKLKELESEIRTNRIGGKFLDKQKVLEIMEDPAMVRTIKNHGSPELKKAFDGPRQKIYREHDRKLVNELAQELKMDPKDLEVDHFRTPGDTGDSLNTDNDYRVVRKVKMKNGKIAKIEVSRKIFEAKSYRIFGELTDKPPHISDADWAARKQQLATDFNCEEASIDYSDQGIDPKTGQHIQKNSNILDVKEGKAKLKNPDSMGEMYKAKVKNAGERPEKYAQAQKATKTIKKVKEGYTKQHKVKPTSEKLKKAMKIIDEQPTDIDMTPQKMAKAHKKLQDLGYKNGLGDVMEDINKEFKALKNVQKKSIFTREFNWFN